ncbi:glycyl-tRNA synthetase beta chain [Melghirimyces profundicolus]|uniref:Glycine--tRNA ligase beta subunit n=1 Tax=Melghirimyces profundicolus TaxID=1242148 RepID=A0A2T6C9D0_9BACL|nr:glycine--tRNA ligase subunit beta [Melghirimyces profundicolus]PTX64876.1 glycyl-tRNA synthetase beta chain [Melghirimyces profundicolus]
MAERDLLLEIGVEEMPARFVESGRQQLKETLEKWLKNHRIGHGPARSYATPRRLAVVVEKVSERQEDVEAEVRGPAKRIAVAEDGSWTKAAQGFARKQGISVDQLRLKDYKGEAYVFARKHEEGQPTADLLNKGLAEILEGLHFPKSMRWGRRRTRFIRPVRWLVCLFGEETVPANWAGVTAADRTRGHRFLGKETVIKTPSDYVEVLRKEWVLADVEERRNRIREQLSEMEKEQGWNIHVDEELLDEVTHLVEYPTALYGTFDESYLELPAAVLITTMREHQRYFPVENTDGGLLPYFVTVRNGDEHALSNVARGNEKVLSARLADARFFYEEDLKLPIEKAVAKLDDVVYFEGLGSVGDQVRRIRLLVEALADRIGLDEKARVSLFRASEICKFDLSTHMVDEFPELSGVMGKEYAEKAGESPEVARAILEYHYPRFAGDRLPEGTPGAVISLADKMDTVVSAFSLGIQPTGSQDPYGLRRRASGVVQILVDRGWSNITLGELTDLCLERLKSDGWLKRDATEVKRELAAFFGLRLKAVLQEEGIRYDLIDAVLASDTGLPRLVVEKARVLGEEVEKEEFKNVAEGFSRAANLAAKGTPGAEVNRDLLEAWSERELYAAINSARDAFEAAREEQDARGMFEAIAKLAPVIHRFFDDVLVMAEDEGTRMNRLALLGEIKRLTDEFAAFNKIVIAS